MRFAPIRRVECAKGWQPTVVDYTARNLIRGIPSGAVAHRGNCESLPRVALTVPNHTIQTAVLFRIHPGTVVVPRLERDEQMSRADARRCGRQAASKPVTTRREPYERAIEEAHVIDIRRACRREMCLRHATRPGWPWQAGGVPCRRSRGR